MLNDIRELVKSIKNILADYEYFNESKPMKINSVYLFKKIYNLHSNLKIDKSKLNDYDINSCIYDNLKDNNCRFLLLEIKPSLAPLIYQHIKLIKIFNEKLKIYFGNPFIEDKNKYLFKNIL